jgi:SAM-dependent methyltransferase
MNETTKSNKYRDMRMFKGQGIDIGAGNDPQINCTPWDKEQGDAQKMQGVLDNEYDFVYSSHCLEHMVDVKESLSNWIRILKPGGLIYITVPSYEWYEKCTWPSRFNSDHKQSFSLDLRRNQVGRQNHWHFFDDLVPLMPRIGIVNASLMLLDYDFNKGVMDQTLGKAICQIDFYGYKI